MTAALTKPLVVPEYTTATVNMYVPDGVTGAARQQNTFDVQDVVTALFPPRTAAVNACALTGNDLFIANSSANSQCIFKVADYVTNPENLAARTFVFTLDGNDYVGILTDGADELFAAEGDYQNNHVVMYTGAANGFPGADAAAGDNYATRVDLGNAGATSYFANLALDSARNLWVSDYLNHRLVVFDAANLGQTNTFHVLANVAGPISVANTNATLRADAADHLFAEPEGLAFDASGDLWVANNNDGNGAGALQNTRCSLVRITPNLQNAVLASAPGATFSPNAANSNTDFFIYQVPNRADDAGARPQFGGLQIDRAAARIYVSEEVGGNGRAYDIATIADIGTATAPNDLAIVTTNPGNGGIALVSNA